MITFDELATRWELSPIRNCPGRFVIRPPAAELSPHDLLGPDAKIHRFCVAAAKDMIHVARLSEGGLISYSRADGTYLHTLNTTEGFERKLLALGIELESKQKAVKQKRHPRP
jgi:hypothetical protein